MHRLTVTTWAAATLISCAGCATSRPVAVTCPAPLPIPPALSQRANPSMQDELATLLQGLLPAAPESTTDSPPR